jgi:vacuolar-type H+-ATPase subunit E/Vma4
MTAPSTEAEVRDRPAGDVVPDALAPVRAALIARATADARQLVAQAEADADSALSAAERQAADIRGEAAASVAREEAAVLGQARSRSRRQGRAIVLDAQRAVYDDLRARSRAAARGLRADPEYPTLLSRLTDQARAELGSDARITEHPDGGLVAEADGRRLVLTLDEAADRAVDRLGVAVERLWLP